MISILGVEHTGLIAADPEALARWYRETFGARELSRSESTPPIIFLTFGGGSLLELVPGTEGAAGDRVHLCFGVPRMEQAVEFLREQGIALERPVFTAYEGSSVVFFRDPTGNMLQLVERVDGSTLSATVFTSAVR